MKSFKNFYVLKENEQVDPNSPNAVDKDWKKNYHNLTKGFIPPKNMRPIIDAFANSSSVVVMKDVTDKHLTMPKKTLYLVGGPVRDFILGKSIKDYDLCTDATPEQIATILAYHGFKSAGDRTGKKGAELQLPFKSKIAEPGDRKIWFIKGRDGAGKAFVVSAVVDGEEFEIATFRQDLKMGDVSPDAASRDKRTPKTNFVESPHGDASRRDFTINSLYIELTKSDGENNKLYDPTGKGLHDVKHGVVRTVGKAKDRFDEDPLRILRGVRFHSRFSKSEQLDGDMESALPDYDDLDKKVSLERIRDEFLKGLMHPDTNIKTYLAIYTKKGLMNKVFPGIKIHPDIPSQFADKRDKPLALAWLMQGNPLEEVDKALSGVRSYEDGSRKPTGWSSEEKRAVMFLLKLLEFQPKDISQFMVQRRGTGLSEQQIRDWANMFNYTDARSAVRNHRGPQWVAMMKTFSNHAPSVKWDSISHKFPDIPKHLIGSAIADEEATAFKNKLPKE
jgi:tRNA nucleotidyltransferase/poly(A) polymerase